MSTFDDTAGRSGLSRLIRVTTLGPACCLAALLGASPTWAQGSPRAEDPCPAGSCAHDSARFAIVRRSVSQDQSAWVVDYELRYLGLSGLILTPDDWSAQVEGWVSNSRVPSHAVPRLSKVSVEGRQGGSGSAVVIASNEESQRCRERAAITVGADDGPRSKDSTAPALVSLGPGMKLRARIRLEHHHVLYGNYDPLLGTRKLELRLGPATLRDQIALEQEHYLAQPAFAWPSPPEGHRDTRRFISAPDSLHLESQVPGHMYYRYPERPVRYGTKLQLCFWYLIAEGTEGECRIRLAQYKDTPSSWLVLTGGGFDRTLDKVGRWTKYETIVRTENEATTVALDFRIISETNVGEMWIDDVTLEPITNRTCPRSP